MELTSVPVVLPARGVARGFRQRSCQRPAVARRRQTAVVAMAAGSSDAGGLFRDQKKDAARRALEQALSGKKDILADVERMRGGDDGGSSGSGGGGGGWNPFNWGKGGGGEEFKRESFTTAKAVGAILGVILVLTCWKPMLAIPVNLVYYTFRIPRELPEAEAAPAAASAEEDVLKRLGQEEE